MAVAVDTAGTAVYMSAVVTNEDTGERRFVGYWAEDGSGQPVTDPDRLVQLEARMAKERKYEDQDLVTVLDDDGEDREDFKGGVVLGIVGPGTYLIELDDRRQVGVPDTHLKSRKE